MFHAEVLRCTVYNNLNSHLLQNFDSEEGACMISKATCDQDPLHTSASLEDFPHHQNSQILQSYPTWDKIPQIEATTKFRMKLLKQIKWFILTNILYRLTPVSQMEVGCSSIWGLKPTTQTQVGGTPHKPALLATQPRAPPAIPHPKSSTRHTEQ